MKAITNRITYTTAHAAILNNAVLSTLFVAYALEIKLDKTDPLDAFLIFLPEFKSRHFSNFKMVVDIYELFTLPKKHKAFISAIASKV